MEPAHSADLGDCSIFSLLAGERFPPRAPEKIKAIGAGFVSVRLASMPINADKKSYNFRLDEQCKGLGVGLRGIFRAVVLHALHGRRKVSTVYGWCGRMDQFVRRAEIALMHPINSLSLQLVLWEMKQGGVSYQKLLRGFLKYWLKCKFPGLQNDLKVYLQTSKVKRNKSPIELQAEKPSERPFSFSQMRQLIALIEKLYVSCEFSPQDNLLWRLIATEALRPSQIRLLQFGDIEQLPNGKVELKVALVKSHGTPARDMMMAVPLTGSVARAIKDHVAFVTTIGGVPPRDDAPILCVTRNVGREQAEFSLSMKVGIHNQINRTRKYIAHLIEDIEDTDLFTRRFKHTKLTHLAMLGASHETLMRAAFHTTRGSVSIYVNMTDEAFDDAEKKMAESNTQLRDMFDGKIVGRGGQTNKADENLILDPGMEEDLGACASRPCGVYAPFGCYICPRFEPFADGPHQVVLDVLLDSRERAIKTGLPTETVEREDNLISAVQTVIRLVNEFQGSLNEHPVR